MCGVLRLRRAIPKIGTTTSRAARTSVILLGRLISIAQRLSRLQRVLDALLRLLLTAQRLEGLALEVEQVLLAYQRPRRDSAAAQDFRDFARNLHFVVADVLALPH